MQRPASAATVGDIGNEGIAHVRHNKLQTRFISGHGSQRWQERRFAYALGSLCSYAPASLASISARVCVPEMYRFHAHAPRTFRCDNPARDLIHHNISARASHCAGGGVRLPPGTGKQTHAPEGRGPRCRRRAQSLVPCAIAGNHTRCTCAAEPLVYRNMTRR